MGLNNRHRKLLDNFVKKVFSLANMDYQTFDLESYIDSSLSYEENKEIIIEKLRELGVLTKEIELELGLIKHKDLEEEMLRFEMEMRKKEEEEIRRRFKEEIKKIKEKSIPEVEKYFKPIFESVEFILNSNKKGLLIIGEKGIGKSFNTLAYLNKKNTEFILIKGHITPLSLYKLLYHNQDKLFVFDDTLKLLKDEDSLSILLGALDKEGLVKWITSQSFIDVPSEFLFKGKIIIIANRVSASNEYLEALLDRCSVLEFNLKREEKIKLMYELVKAMKMPYEIVDFISELLINPSLRDLETGIECYKIFKDKWKEVFVRFVREFDEDLRKVLELEKDKTKSPKERISEFMLETGKSRRTYYRYKKRLKRLGLI